MSESISKHPLTPSSSGQALQVKPLKGGQKDLVLNQILPRTLISSLSQNISQTVLIKGFLHKKRSLSKNLLFVIIRDRTGLVQIVVQNSGEIAKLDGLQTRTILSLTG